MKLIQRVAYYGAGFVVGLILLFFFLGGKKASCDYGFDSRTLKNIRSKQLMVSQDNESVLKALNIDTLDIKNILNTGDVDFSETDRSLDSCKIYWIAGKIAAKNIRMKIENCNEHANILAIEQQ